MLVRCIGETKQAILIESDELDGERWVPKSVITDDSEVWEAPQEGNLIVEDWWADVNSFF